MDVIESTRSFLPAERVATSGVRFSGLGHLDHGTGEFGMAQGEAAFRAEKSDVVVIRALSHPFRRPESPELHSQLQVHYLTPWLKDKTTCSSTSGATSRFPRAEDHARTTHEHARACTRTGGGVRPCGAHRHVVRI